MPQFDLNKFKDFFVYFDPNNPQKKEAVKRLYDSILEARPDLLTDEAYWVQAWRTRPPAPPPPPGPPAGTAKVSCQGNITLQAQHYSDSCGQCCAAMLITDLSSPAKSVDDYWVRARYGFNLLGALNTNTGGNHWIDAGNFSSSMWDSIYNSIKNGKAVMIGLNGPAFSPSGYGHILLIVAIDGNNVVLADPNGGHWRTESKQTIENCPPHSEGKFVFRVA